MARPVSIPTAPAHIVTAFTPTGVLRASINLGNPILANTDPSAGTPCGVSDLARAFAERLGVPLNFVAFTSAGQSVEAVTNEKPISDSSRWTRSAAQASASLRPMC